MKLDLASSAASSTLPTSVPTPWKDSGLPPPCEPIRSSKQDVSQSVDQRREGVGSEAARTDLATEERPDLCGPRLAVERLGLILGQKVGVRDLGGQLGVYVEQEDGVRRCAQRRAEELNACEGG